MSKDYKFLRTIGGITYFARVWVDVELTSGTITVMDTISEKVDPDAGEFNVNSAPSWVTAALEGAREAVQQLVKAGALRNGCTVRICKLVGSIVDTREDVVACASALAAWQAAAPSLPLPEAVFESGAWKLQYPKIEQHIDSNRS